jgi:hypothetical protein
MYVGGCSSPLPLGIVLIKCKLWVKGYLLVQVQMFQMLTKKHEKNIFLNL